MSPDYVWGITRTPGVRCTFWQFVNAILTIAVHERALTICFKIFLHD